MTKDEKRAKAIKTANSVCNAALACVQAACPTTAIDPQRITGIEIHPEGYITIMYADGRKEEKRPGEKDYPEIST